MTLVSGRADRRRRILNDGRLGTDAEIESSATASDSDAKPGNLRRYAPEASSVSFGIATRLLPTNPWALAGASLGGLLVTGLLVAGELYRTQLSETLGATAAALFDLSSPTSLAAFSRLLLSLLVFGISGVVFGLRRQRSDDLKGVYRWWLTATFACGIVALSLATGLHKVVASGIAAQVGWSPIANNAFWWLAPSVLLGGGLVGRLFFDLKECRLAATTVVLGVIASGVAAAASQGWAPAAITDLLPVIEFGATQFALLAAAFALLAYSRRIVLEAEGRAAAPVKRDVATKPLATEEKPEQKQPTKAAKSKPKAAAATVQSPPAAASAPENASQKKPRIAAETKRSKPAAASTEWVDGSQGGGDDYDDDHAPRKLSKAERKRLRRQKARQGRAA